MTSHRTSIWTVSELMRRLFCNVPAAQMVAKNAATRANAAYRLRCHQNGTGTRPTCESHALRQLVKTAPSRSVAQSDLPKPGNGRETVEGAAQPSRCIPVLPQVPGAESARRPNSQRTKDSTGSLPLGRASWPGPSGSTTWTSTGTCHCSAGISESLMAARTHPCRRAARSPCGDGS
jgi:hypothetical protein